MKIRLNMNLHGHKKGEIIDLELCSVFDARYWRKSIKDSKIDKSVSIVNKKVILEEKKKKKLIKMEVNNDSESK